MSPIQNTSEETLSDQMTSRSPPETVPTYASVFDNPMVRAFGIVGIFFLITLFVGTINFCIWLSQLKRSLFRCGDDDGGTERRGTSLAFPFGKSRSAVGHDA